MTDRVQAGLSGATAATRPSWWRLARSRRALDRPSSHRQDRMQSWSTKPNTMSWLSGTSPKPRRVAQGLLETMEDSLKQMRVHLRQIEAALRRGAS